MRVRTAGVPGALLVGLLSLPCLRLGYFWDDYVFLTRVQSNPIAALGPEPGVFYRPIPRVFYFWPMASLGSNGALIAHAINLLLLATSAWLLASLVGRVAGAKAGALAGIAFATLAPVPSLVAWASASQDLLAILFALTAFHLRHSGRILWAGVAFAAGLLSKETTAVLAPAIVLWTWIVGERPARVRAAALTIGGILLLWLFLHPGIRALGNQAFAIQPRGYVGFSNLAVSEFQARRYLLALFNVPETGGPLFAVAVAAAVVVIGLALLGKKGHETDARRRLSIPRAFLLAFLISAPTLILPALMIQRWAAYFACLPGVGSALLIGVLLSRIPTPAAAICLVVFAALGVSIRGSRKPSQDAMTERRFIEANDAIRRVEAGFRSLHPAFPSRSQVFVSVASSGPLGIDGTMLDGQPLRIWYRDPTIQVLRPESQWTPRRAEFLFRITSERDVVEIDPDRGSLRASGGRPDPEEMRAITRTYARGLAASGESARSIRILTRLAAGDPPPVNSYDLRLAAMAALASGDSADGAKLLGQAPPIPREFALESVARVMAQPTGRADLDSLAFQAFGVSSGDPDALRYLMNMFYSSLLVPQAIEFARRLQVVAPGDSGSAEVLARLGARH